MNTPRHRLLDGPPALALAAVLALAASPAPANDSLGQQPIGTLTLPGGAGLSLTLCCYPAAAGVRVTFDYAEPIADGSEPSDFRITFDPPGPGDLVIGGHDNASSSDVMWEFQGEATSAGHYTGEFVVWTPGEAEEGIWFFQFKNDRADDLHPNVYSNVVVELLAPDCNDNGQADWVDIGIGAGSDANRNGQLDECETIGDMTGDGLVNAVDLAYLLGAWSLPAGSPGCEGAAACPADLNADGLVNAADLSILLGAWTL